MALVLDHRLETSVERVTVKENNMAYKRDGVINHGKDLIKEYKGNAKARALAKKMGKKK